MKICPKCQTKYQDSSNFCKKCGFKLSEPPFQEKKEKVIGGGKKKPYWIPLALVMIAIGLIGIGYKIIQDKTLSPMKISSQPKIKGKFNYTGQTIKMTDISAKVVGGKISIPLDIVKEKKLIRFEYEGNGGKIPLLAYITPSGRVITAISMCEPCRSTRFHINGNKLVCNACFTEWDIEKLKGIQGGCLNYPPDAIQSTIEDNKILIEEKLVSQWKPRI